MNKFVIITTLLAVATGPALGQPLDPASKSRAAHSERSQPKPDRGGAANAYAQAPRRGEKPAEADRARMLQECSEMEQKYPNYTWGVWEMELFRECMHAHRQPE